MNTGDQVDDLKRYAIRTEAAFIDEAPDVVARAMEGKPARSRPFAAQFAKVAAALLVAGLGVGTLGVAADGSVPGQLLYPVDRSVEGVLATLGLSTPDQRLAERTLEVRVLLDRNEPDMALETLLTAVRTEAPHLSPEEAEEHKPALLESVERLLSWRNAAGSDQELPGLIHEIEESLGITLRGSGESPLIDDLLDRIQDDG